VRVLHSRRVAHFVVLGVDSDSFGIVGGEVGFDSRIGSVFLVLLIAIEKAVSAARTAIITVILKMMVILPFDFRTVLSLPLC
jgi:hypothetical protein